MCTYIGPCIRACTRMCRYSDAHVRVMHAQLAVSVSSRMPTIYLFFSHDVLFIIFCISICANMLPSLCINVAHICEDACVKCIARTVGAVGNVSSYHHILNYSFIKV